MARKTLKSTPLKKILGIRDSIAFLFVGNLDVIASFAHAAFKQVGRLRSLFRPQPRLQAGGVAKAGGATTQARRD